MADLTEAKRQMQAGHQATLKMFGKQGEAQPTTNETLRPQDYPCCLLLRVLSLTNTQVARMLVLRESPL